MKIKSNPGFIFGQTELRRDKVGKKEKEGEWGGRKSNPGFIFCQTEMRREKVGEKEKEGEWGGCREKHRSWERGCEKARGKQIRRPLQSLLKQRPIRLKQSMP